MYMNISNEQIFCKNVDMQYTAQIGSVDGGDFSEDRHSANTLPVFNQIKKT